MHIHHRFKCKVSFIRHQINDNAYLCWNIWATNARFRFADPSTMSFGVTYLLQSIFSACSIIKFALSVGFLASNVLALPCSGARTLSKLAYASPSCKWHKPIASVLEVGKNQKVSKNYLQMQIWKQICKGCFVWLSNDVNMLHNILWMFLLKIDHETNATKE